MSGVQANWGIGAGTPVNTDSTALQQMAQLKSGAQMIDLTTSPEEIQSELTRLMGKEGRFEANGLACGLKWEEGHRLMGGARLSCFNCPNYTEDKDDAFSVVCKVGRAQESLVDRLKAVTAVEALDEAYIAAVERDIEHCEALAEAVAS